MNEFMVIDNYSLAGTQPTINLFDSVEEAREYQEEFNSCEDERESGGIASLVYVYKCADEEMIDCMTVIIDDLHVIGMSQSALGFNQYCGETWEKMGHYVAKEDEVTPESETLVDLTTIEATLKRAIIERTQQ